MAKRGPFSRRDFIKAAGLSLAGLTASGMSTGGPAVNSGKKPNILFIFSDDQTFDSINALGNKEVKTPNLDRLVKSGVTFTHAYNQGSWSKAICVASRTMLNTGRFVWDAKKIDDRAKDKKAKPTGKFWSELMSDTGYTTYFAGKWHVKKDVKSIFDHVLNMRGGMPKQTEAGYNRPVEGKPDEWSPYDTKFGGYWEGGKHWSEALGDDAQTFIKQAAKESDPFFMYLAFNAPHDPRQSPKEYVDMYPVEDVKVPENFLPEYPYKQEMGCFKLPKGEKHTHLRDEELAPWPRTEHAVKVHRQEYYAIISHMDTQVGRMLDELEAQGLSDSTYVFFISDHGLALGSHGLIGKQNMYEHSLRSPLIVSGPGIKKNKKIDSPVYLQDIMPTTLELAGADVPEYVQYKSLMPLINGKRKKNYDYIYGAYLDLQRAIIYGDYKLIAYPEAKKLRLYDLKKDPLEMNDLTDNPKYKKVKKDMFDRLARVHKESGDYLDLRAIYTQM